MLLACFPKVRSKALKVDFHVLNFVYARKVLIKAKEPRHGSVSLLKLLGFLLKQQEALLGTLTPGFLKLNSIGSLGKTVDAVLHLLFDNNKASLKRHDVIMIGSQLS